MSKPVHAKPALYAYYFYPLKEIAMKYGYNLVLHGSLNRDLDLIAIPWNESIGSHDEMIEEFVAYMGGSLIMGNGVDRDYAIEIGEQCDGLKYSVTHHGRMQYIINLNRGEIEKSKGWPNGWNDPQYYIDISVLPTQTN